MDAILSLWLPIILSAVAVFIASSIIWMATPLHKHDYKDPGTSEGALLDTLRTTGLSPGVYFVPWVGCSGKPDQAAMDKMKRGPWAMLTVMSGAPNMGKTLGLWFVHLLIVGVFVAYITGLALPHGAPYLKVFQVAGTAAFLAYGGYAFPLSIWHAQPWSQLPLRIIDGLIYALVTAGVFGWLWPKLSVAVPSLPA